MTNNKFISLFTYFILIVTTDDVFAKGGKLPLYRAPVVITGTDRNTGTTSITYSGYQHPDDSSNNPDDSSNNPDDSSNNPDDSSNNPDDSSNNPDDSPYNPDDSPYNPDDPFGYNRIVKGISRGISEDDSSLQPAEQSATNAEQST